MTSMMATATIAVSFNTKPPDAVMIAPQSKDRAKEAVGAGAPVPVTNF